MSGLEIRCLAAGMEESALDLLRAVAGEETGRFFTPHPFTRDAIVALASHPGKDLYYLLVDGSRSLAYGLLRGWNDGYAIPSLGLAVSPSARRQGYGVLMTHFLHAAARQAGANRIRLRVHQENSRAIALYRSCGYVFSDPPEPVNGLLVGFCDLVTG
jgi:ribosomal protein S18 acetylase RimI-like enzyme